MDPDNNININMPPVENKVLIIQRAWRDFLQRQEVEKRSLPCPPLLLPTRQSMSISMTTLSDGSTPASHAYLKHILQSFRTREKIVNAEPLYIFLTLVQSPPLYHLLAHLLFSWLYQVVQLQQQL
ncbi:IQ domain-containing protein J-like protein [Lates japonicus]|uniref:IQ domain-containing protein J-like protein n=1 Tax=Lates japonicus TaxID=270547 RepID=A0AAD3MF78_LATJO|nr:IQ domain-containing protein J-like protein [Lates japonicus]